MKMYTGEESSLFKGFFYCKADKIYISSSLPYDDTDKAYWNMQVRPLYTQSINLSSCMDDRCFSREGRSAVFVQAISLMGNKI